MISDAWIAAAIVGLSGGLVFIWFYFAKAKDWPPIVRQRVILRIAIMLIGALGGEVFAIRFLEDQSGHVGIGQKALSAAAGLIVGVFVAEIAVPFWCAKPPWRAPITIVVICSLLAGVGSVLGASLGGTWAVPQLFEAEERLRIMRSWMSFGAAVGATGGLLLGGVYAAIQRRSGHSQQAP